MAGAYITHMLRYEKIKQNVVQQFMVLHFFFFTCTLFLFNLFIPFLAHKFYILLHFAKQNCEPSNNVGQFFKYYFQCAFCVFKQNKTKQNTALNNFFLFIAWNKMNNNKKVINIPKRTKMHMKQNIQFFLTRKMYSNGIAHKMKMKTKTVNWKWNRTTDQTHAHKPKCSQILSHKSIADRKT